MMSGAADLQTIISPLFDQSLLTETLQRIYNLESCAIEDIIFNTDRKKGDSYLSDVSKFKVKATGKERNTGSIISVDLPMISKALPKNIGHRKTFRSLDFFKNEVSFYNKVWKAMRDFQTSKSSIPVFSAIPLCISAVADGTNDYVVLEDLSHKDFTGIARCSGLDLNHTKLILNLFARFHGLSLAFKDQQQDKFEQVANSLDETYFADKYRNWYCTFQTKNLFPVVRDAIAKQLSPPYLNKLNALLETDFFGTLIQHCSTKGPLAAITHGDAWVPNFLVKYDQNKTPVEAMIIDFQLARYSSLAMDITFFLYSCTEKWLWAKHWDDLIAEYHAALTDALEKLGSSPALVSLEDLKVEIKKCAIFGIGMSMEAIVMSLLEDNETADLGSIREDEDVPLESVWILHPFQSEEKRQRLADMIQHAVDNGFI